MILGYKIFDMPQLIAFINLFIKFQRKTKVVTSLYNYYMPSDDSDHKC